MCHVVFHPSRVGSLTTARKLSSALDADPSREPARHKGNLSNNTMKTTTAELLAANDALRDEYPTACIVDAAMDCKGFKLTVIPASINEDSQIGKGATVEDALADLRAKFIANDPVAKIRKQAEELGYGLLKLPQD
jgi:hypothetical protein